MLKNTLASIQDDYDYILIDTPPALGDQTINALSASDAVVVLFESSKFCYTALGASLIRSSAPTKSKSNLKVAGILRSMIDPGRTSIF